MTISLSSITIDIIHSGDAFSAKAEVKTPVMGRCKRCGYIASQEFCKACVLLQGLNKGKAKLAVGAPRVTVAEM